MRPYLDAPRPIAFAHRGGAALWPENTLAAFRGALALGYRYVETDMHVTADGEVVLIHDATVDRTTDGRGEVAKMTLAELRRLDAGHRFRRDGGFPFRGAGERVPTLEEALDLDPGLRFNVEIKARDPRAVRIMWERIEALGVHDRVLVAAARSGTGRAFRRVSRGRVATSAGAAEILAFWVAARSRTTRWLPLDYDALQVPVRHRGMTVVDRRLVEAAHGRGLQVHVWTIDDPREMGRLRALSVDGIMTDRPDLLDPGA